MAKKRKTRKEIAVENARLADVQRRFLNRNLEAMKFCNEQGLTVYAAAQKNNKVKVFVQHHEKFRPVNNIEYDQYDEKEVMEYHAIIDKVYEKMYNLKKDGIRKKKG